MVWLDGDYQLHTNFGGLVPMGAHYGGDPAISDTNVVWFGRDVSDNDWEIYMATYTPDVVPLPGAVLLGALGLGMAGLKLRKYACPDRGSLRYSACQHRCRSGRLAAQIVCPLF